MYGFGLLFQLRYGSFLDSFGSHELGLFNCFLRVFASVFSFIFRLLQLFSLSFVRSFTAFLSSNIHYLLFTAVLSLHLTTRRSDSPRMRQFLLRPTQATVRCYARTSIEIDASVFLESLFGDTFWSIRMEHGHRLEHFFGICFVNGV